VTGGVTRRKRRVAQATGAESAPYRPRVLLVENDAHDSERIIPVLDTLGFAVDIAVDAEAGLRQEERREYAGAIVDLNLSSGTRCEGFGLIAKLRALGRRYPIVIVSHNSGVEYEIRGFEAGADDYMVKWPQREEMRARLDRVIPSGAGQDRGPCPPGHGQ
jgi:DNA-binding response OmpR family regulator